jgi:hypothetical protein
MSVIPETLTGQCLCGGVRFEVRPPTKWCAHCHCTMCQRAQGAAFVTWVGTDQDQVAIRGDTLAWYASSAGAERGFCSHCGSPLFFRSVHWPGELHITRASFSNGMDREPQGHVFYESHVSWCQLADSLPKNPRA